MTCTRLRRTTKNKGQRNEEKEVEIMVHDAQRQSERSIIEEEKENKRRQKPIQLTSIKPKKRKGR